MTIVSDARDMLRDFPKYFTTVYDPPLQSTIRLDHPLVSDITITSGATTLSPTDGSYLVDYRNGLVKLADASLYPDGVVVGGYHYLWFLDTDLELHARFVSQEHLYHRDPNTSASDLSQPELNIIAMGTVVMALWTLLSEFATEYDVTDPEGITIPAHQRFQQVLQMYQVWEKKYLEGASALNVGYGRTMVTELRRTSKWTGRLVPIFENQEVDDPRYPLRTLPVIEPKFTELREESEAMSYGGPQVGGWPI